MRRRLPLTGVATIIALLTLYSPSSAGVPVSWPASQAAEAPAADGMLAAWQAFSSGLGDDARQAAAFPFDGEERLTWNYTPVDRTGLRIGDLDPTQTDALHAFLRTGFGDDGLAQAFDIVKLEELLYETSGGRAMRDPGNYYLGNFGEPSLEGPWGWRFEGHHLSVSFTVAGGRVVSSTPAFFGGNPAVVPDDAPVHAGLAPFATEQQAAFDFVAGFDPAELQRIVVAGEAPDDILTSNERRAARGAPEGMAYGDMSEEQQSGLLDLMGRFLDRMSPDLAAYQRAKVQAAGLDQIHFAWAGGTEPGSRHYFRIQGPTFVIEWDNTQGDGNHVHSVYRDFDDDFGHDPLGRHLAAGHGVAVPGLAR